MIHCQNSWNTFHSSRSLYTDYDDSDASFPPDEDEDSTFHTYSVPPSTLRMEPSSGTPTSLKAHSTNSYLPPKCSTKKHQKHTLPRSARTPASSKPNKIVLFLTKSHRQKNQMEIPFTLNDLRQTSTGSLLNPQKGKIAKTEKTGRLSKEKINMTKILRLISAQQSFARL